MTNTDYPKLKQFCVMMHWIIKVHYFTANEISAACRICDMLQYFESK